MGALCPGHPEATAASWGRSTWGQGNQEAGDHSPGCLEDKVSSWTETPRTTAWNCSGEPCLHTLQSIKHPQIPTAQNRLISAQFRVLCESSKR